jgi:hypothetical protein
MNACFVCICTCTSLLSLPLKFNTNVLMIIEYTAVAREEYSRIGDLSKANQRDGLMTQFVVESAQNANNDRRHSSSLGYSVRV